MGAEHDVGGETEDRVTPAHRAAFDRFEQEARPAGLRQLQMNADRRFQIGDEPRRQNLRAAGLVGARERPVEAGLEPHQLT